MSVSRASCAVASALVGLFCVGCDSDARDGQPLGDLVYSGPVGGLYRLDRRVEFVPSERVVPAERSKHAGCGHLTERAEAEIESALARLDPEGSYEIDVQACQWRWGADATSTRVHIEGFTHSPFTCATECCAEDMDVLLGLYLRTAIHAQGAGKEHDELLESVGIEAYAMIEPDEPCSSGGSR